MKLIKQGIFVTCDHHTLDPKTAYESHELAERMSSPTDVIVAMGMIFEVDPIKEFALAVLNGDAVAVDAVKDILKI